MTLYALSQLVVIRLLRILAGMNDKATRFSITANEFRKQTGEYLNRTYYTKDTFTITKSGKPFAVLLPVDRLQRLEALEASDTSTSPALSDDSVLNLARNMLRKESDSMTEALESPYYNQPDKS
jgi:prevent-host-death family protein